MTTVIDSLELRSWMHGARHFTLIDVLTEECFKAQRLPGARRASIYEVTFLDQIAALSISPEDPLILYGAGDGSLDCAVAAEKLQRAGFRNIYLFNGGRAEWARTGGSFEGEGPLMGVPTTPEDKQYLVNPKRSSLEWMGRNLNSTHHGTVGISKGHLTIAGGSLVEGQIVLNMRSIENTDLADPLMRKLLEMHLKSDDFFDVERCPTAEIDLLSANPLFNATQGTPNCQISANLTLKSVCHPITFPAIIALGEDGVLTATAQIEIDRTQWNVLYGSGRFFKMLGKHLVNDAITLIVKVVAE